MMEKSVTQETAGFSQLLGENQGSVQLPLNLRGVHCHLGRKRQYCGSGGRGQRSSIGVFLPNAMLFKLALRVLSCAA